MDSTLYIVFYNIFWSLYTLFVFIWIKGTVGKVTIGILWAVSTGFSIWYIGHLKEKKQIN